MATIEGDFFSAYKIIQILSIDIVLGAMAVGYFTIHLLGVEANPAWWFILPMAVWSFYTSDHLIDGFKSKEEATIKRHGFHYKHRKVLGMLAALFGLTAFVFSLLFLNRQIIHYGLLVGVAVLTYFGLLFLYAKKKPFLLQKELIIAFVYVFGIWLAPLVWHAAIPRTFILLILAVFLLLAWAEGIMASSFDFENDIQDGHSSFTVLFGKRDTRRFLIVIHILVFLMIKLSIFFISTNLQFTALMILALMNLCLMLITLYPKWFQKNERYRIVGESVFLLPALIAFF